jgi:hypothetical protein
MTSERRMDERIILNPILRVNNNPRLCNKILAQDTELKESLFTN